MPNQTAREWRWTIALALILLGACAESEATPSSTSTNTQTPTTAATRTPLEPPTTQAAIAATTTVPARETSLPVDVVASTTTSVTEQGPLEFLDGKFVGISQGSLLTDATRALGVTPVRLSELDQTEPVYACTGTSDPWVIRTGGLTLVFETPPDAPADDAFLTNWRYIGGPVAGFTELVAPHEIRIGDARDEVEAAYPDFLDLGEELQVGGPVLRFGIVNETVDWFGTIDCVFESVPTD